MILGPNPKWCEPKIFGLPPSPRYAHTMVYNENLNFIAIHGGKNSTSGEIFLSDTFILTLSSLQWVIITHMGNEPCPRAHHCSVSYDTKILIFGGINQTGLIKSECEVLELDLQLVQLAH